MAQLKTVVEEFDGTFEKLCDYDSTNIKNNPSKTSLEGAMKVYQSLYDEIYKKQSYIRKGFYDKVNPVYDGNVHPSTPISLTPSNP